MKRNSVASLNKTDQLYRRLDELCALIPEVAEPGELVFWFVQLVRWLRGSGSEARGLRLRYLRTRLEQHDDARDNLRRCITAMVTGWDFEQLMAYGGIARDFHFFGALREWLSYRGLPIACDTQDPVSVLSLAFRDEDRRWLDETEVGLLANMLVDGAARPQLQAAVEEALVELGTQLMAQAHAPNVRTLSRVERSPYRGLQDAIVTFLAQPRSERRPDALHGRLRQCRLQLDTHKKQLADRGADLNTTFQLDRISQQLERAALLVCVLCTCAPRQLGDACIAVIRAVTRNTSGRRLIGRSSELLVRNLVDTTASVGHHYLSEEKSSWRAAFIAGAGVVRSW
jgi:site-specific recombinase